jgi:tetratricopeptide (TPR) repeat protein
MGWVFLLPAYGVLPCAKCHPKETAGLAATPMGRSLAVPTRVPAGSFRHAISGTQFTVEYNGSKMVQRITRDGITARYEIAYQVGSGTHAYAYLIELDHHLFQSPLGYFASRGWAMSPGYEKMKAPDFYRPVTTDCLFCHSGQARPVPGAFNTYEDPPFQTEAISCERCHGPAEAHLRAPLPGSIVNPVKLPPRARDSICEQCHLNGEERVPNPGKELSDFRPGKDLEDVFSVYLDAGSRDPQHPDPLKVIGQVQRLALSKCARESDGKLWCGTCHDPHALPQHPKAYFRSKCLACHGSALLKTHPKPVEDCTGCHMPRRPVTDGAHTIFTDHRIAIYSAKELAAATQPSSPLVGHTSALVAWHNPAGALAKRNLGIADVLVGDREEAFSLISRGFDLLRDCLESYSNDPAMLTAIGKALVADRRASDAIAPFELAAQAEPNAAVRYLNLAMAYKALPDPKNAIENFEKALQLDPLLEQAYQELIAVYTAKHDEAMVHDTEKRYLKAFPQNINAQLLNQGIEKSGVASRQGTGNR